jgi:hypothetical protein
VAEQRQALDPGGVLLAQVAELRVAPGAPMTRPIAYDSAPGSDSGSARYSRAPSSAASPALATSSSAPVTTSAMRGSWLRTAAAIWLARAPDSGSARRTRSAPPSASAWVSSSSPATSATT